MLKPPIHIDTEFTDRAVTLSYGRYLGIERVATGAWLGAYLTPLGIRQLIDALEPFAAPRAAPVLPELSGIEYLPGSDPAPAAQWRVEYAPRSGGPWVKSRRVPDTFTSKAAAERALRAERARAPRRYRVVPVDA